MTPTISVARFDLQEEVSRMRSTLRPDTTVHIAKTLVRTDDLRLVLIVMQRGARLDEHHTEGRMTIQGIDGRVQLRMGETDFELADRYLLALDRDTPHALEALEDSSILLSIAWHGHRATAR
jgi:quercetin dioxygenase-like cupin family protein